MRASMDALAPGAGAAPGAPPPWALLKAQGNAAYAARSYAGATYAAPAVCGVGRGAVT